MARSLKVPSFRFNLPRLPKTDEPYEDVFEEMSLAEHLEELRSRLVRTCMAIGVAFIGGLLFSGPLLRVMKEAARAEEGIDILSPTEPITIYFKIALFIAIGFAMPIIVWQLIGFLAPGLTRKEKRLLFSSLPFVSALFVAGSAFAFFLAVPRALKFLSGWLPDIFQWSPNASELINFYLTLMIGMGICFELPIVMFLLAKLNIVSPQRMSKFRKYAFVLILIAAAIITPTPDPFNMTFVAMPIYLLYEGGIILARIFARPNR